MQSHEQIIMSSFIPPILSDSPPPLNDPIDDNEEDDGFGDFRVATDLTFDLSDSSMGRDSPDVWNTPSSNSELSENVKAKVHIISDEELKLQGSDFKSITDPNNLGNGNVENEDLKVTNELHSDEVPLPELELDSPEISEELERITASDIQCSFGLEARTSPEGADAESESIEGKFEVAVENECNASKSIADSEIEVPGVNSEVDLDLNGTGDDDFADFADFSSQPFHDSTLTPAEPKDDAENGEAFGSTPPALVLDDDFEEFDDFESAAPPPSDFPEVDRHSRLAAIFDSPKDVTALAEEVDLHLTGCLNSCLDDSSSVWGNLKDLETSHALALQWTASSANTRLLSSLGVDSRNILIGPRWNSSMPRFAANMGSTPLEPVKAPPDKPPPIRSVAPHQVLPPPTEEVVPAAQFDWNSSGLTNPLDCMEKEEATSVSRQSSQVIKESPSVDEMWPLPAMPITDILLPSPAPPVQSPMDNIPSSLSKIPSEPESLSPDDWLGDVADVVQKRDMMTISSHLESQPSAEILVSKEMKMGTLSPEAQRVVDALPDLSFLSARKLMYAANANMTRFQARP